MSSVNARWVGGVVQGDLNTERLVLNVGGHPTALTELDEQQLRTIRKGVVAAVKKRTLFASMPPSIGAGLLLGAWCYTPAVLRDAPPAPGLSPAESALVVMGVFSIAIWMLMRMYFGAWRKQQLLTVQRLREKLAFIDAELDLRDAQHPNAGGRMWRSLIDSFRG